MHAESLHEVLAEVARGDTNAFAGVLEHFDSFLTACCRRWAGTWHDAEELKQEVAIKFYAFLQTPALTGEPISPKAIRSWLGRVCATTFIDGFRQACCSENRVDKVHRLEPVAHPAGAEDEWMGRLEWLVHDALITEHEWQLLQARVIEERPWLTLETRFGRSTRQLRYELEKTLDRLRRIYLQRGGWSA